MAYCIPVTATVDKMETAAGIYSNILLFTYPHRDWVVVIACILNVVQMELNMFLHTEHITE